MLHCKMDETRSSQWHCGHCQHDEALALSCGNRNCSQCQHQTTSTWLARKLKNCVFCYGSVHYFMVTFTLPYELRILAKISPKALYQSVFKATATILKDFADKKDKGTLGFTSILHTHTRRRDLHPHLHILVPCGRYDANKKHWYKGDSKYLFNTFALAKVWRARMLAEINHSELMGLLDNTPKKWVVDCGKVGFGLLAFLY